MLQSYKKSEEPVTFTLEHLVGTDNYKKLLSEGVLYHLCNDHLSAIKVFDEVIETNPEDINAWLYKGKSLAKLEKHDEAEKCFSLAEKLADEVK